MREGFRVHEAFAGVFALALVSCQGPLGRGERGELRVGVVDLGRVFDLSNERRDRAAELQEILTAGRARIEASALEVAELQRNAEALPEDDPDRVELELRLQEAFDEHRAARAEEQRIFSERWSEAMSDFKVRARDVIQQLGAAGDYDLIVERSIEMEGIKQIGMPGFAWDVVHFSRAELDLTEEVARRLNLAYVERGRVPSRSSGAAPPIQGTEAAPETRSDPNRRPEAEPPAGDRAEPERESAESAESASSAEP